MRWTVGLAVVVAGTMVGCGEIREVPVEGSGGSSSSTSSTGTGTSMGSGDTEVLPPGVSDGDTEEPLPPETSSTTSTSDDPGGSTGEPQERVSFCIDGDVAIPQGTAEPATIELTVEDARTIADLDVMVRVNHEQPTGLTISIMRLEADPLPLLDGATTECQSPGGVVFDDDSIVAASSWCDPLDGLPVVMPNGGLGNAYGGETIGGTWLLEFKDVNEGGATGTISNWCLSAVLN